MAGGRRTEAFNAAAYNTTKFAKMGDLGSKVLKPRSDMYAQQGIFKMFKSISITHILSSFRTSS